MTERSSRLGRKTTTWMIDFESLKMLSRKFLISNYKRTRCSFSGLIFSIWRSIVWMDFFSSEFHIEIAFFFFLNADESINSVEWDARSKCEIRRVYFDFLFQWFSMVFIVFTEFEYFEQENNNNHNWAWIEMAYYSRRCGNRECTMWETDARASCPINWFHVSTFVEMNK